MKYQSPPTRGYDPNLKLAEDDVRGIQALYGEKTNGQTTRRPVTSPPQETRDPSIFVRSNSPGQPGGGRENKVLCNTGGLDTMVTLRTRVTYAFLGNQYWKLTETSVAPG